MTVTIGLATKDCVVLAADSAVTHGTKIVWSSSSLGETSDSENGVEEGALKIVRLGTHAAAAIAGSPHDAVDALTWFKPHVQAVDFVRAWVSAMSVKKRFDFIVLIARWHDGAPELYRCAGNEAERVRPGRPIVVGSLRDDERVTLETRTRLLLVRGHRPHMIQLGVCALLVWRSLNEVGFKDSVGGTPASLLMNSAGVAWMPDTSIYVIDVRPNEEGQPQFQDTIHRLSMIGRDDIVAVASTYTNETRFLASPMSANKLSGWLARWRREVMEIALQNSVKLVALVALIQRRLAVLELDLCQGKYIRVESDQVTFGDVLKAFFRGPPPELPGGAVYSIPLGEPPALAMVVAGGPVDEYDIDLGIGFMLMASVVDKNFDQAERVWESMLSRFPYHPEVLTAGVVALELEPGAPRLDKVLCAWESALAAEPRLVGQARFVAERHPDHPEVARRLLAAVERIAIS